MNAEAATPRMIMIVYYLEEFWPQASHLCKGVLGTWTSREWPCRVKPIKLNELAQTRDILSDCNYETGSFSLFVLYITHSLSGSQGHQVTHDVSYPPVEFFERTLSPVQRIAKRANRKYGILVSCGHPFEVPENVWELKEWMNSEPFNALLCCMDKKISPAFFVTFLTRLSSQLASIDGSAEPEAYKSMLDIWLSDGLVRQHTNMIYLSGYRQPEMWSFSQFSDRPLGKKLPRLLSVCSCTGATEVPSGGFKQGRKVWLVSHNSIHGKDLRDIIAKAECSFCGQMWVLPTEHLVGKLYCHAGLYAAVVPYFVE